MSAARLALESMVARMSTVGSSVSVMLDCVFLIFCSLGVAGA